MRFSSGKVRIASRSSFGVIFFPAFSKINVDFHYLFPVAQSVKLYPLFGLTMSNWMFDMHDLDVDWDGDHVHVDDGGNHNEFRIGANLGVGAEFALGRNWAMNVEFRYQLVDDFDQGVINFGAAYRF